MKGKIHSKFQTCLDGENIFFKRNIRSNKKLDAKRLIFTRKVTLLVFLWVFFGMGGILVCAKSKEEAHGRGSRYTPNGRYRYARKVTESNCTPQGSKISHQLG